MVKPTQVLSWAITYQTNKQTQRSNTFLRHFNQRIFFFPIYSPFLETSLYKSIHSVIAWVFSPKRPFKYFPFFFFNLIIAKVLNNSPISTSNAYTPYSNECNEMYHQWDWAHGFQWVLKMVKCELQISKNIS